MTIASPPFPSPTVSLTAFPQYYHICFVHEYNSFTHCTTCPTAYWKAFSETPFPYLGTVMYLVLNNELLSPVYYVVKLPSVRHLFHLLLCTAPPPLMLP